MIKYAFAVQIDLAFVEAVLLDVLYVVCVSVVPVVFENSLLFEP